MRVSPTGEKGLSGKEERRWEEMGEKEEGEEEKDSNRIQQIYYFEVPSSSLVRLFYGCSYMFHLSGR